MKGRQFGMSVSEMDNGRQRAIVVGYHEELEAFGDTYAEAVAALAEEIEAKPDIIEPVVENI